MGNIEISSSSGGGEEGNGGESFEATVRRLADLEAIRDLARRYAHHVWRKEVDEAVDLFADDGVVLFADDGRTGAREPLRGKAEILATYRAELSANPFQPFVHNHVVDLEDDDHARGRCYLDLRASIDGASLIGSGVYVDTYVREHGRWRFASRTLTMEYLVPVQQGWAEVLAGAGG